MVVQEPDKVEELLRDAVVPLTFADKRYFLELLESLPVRVTVHGDKASGQVYFRVYLVPDDTETEYRVYDAKGRVYEKFPHALLTVYIHEDR